MNRILFFQSLAWPVLLFVFGIITSYYEWIPTIPIKGFTLLSMIPLSICLIIVIRYYGGNKYQLYHIFGLFLFLVIGWSITTIHKIHFDANSAALFQTDQSKGVITKITRFPKLQRIQLKTHPGNVWHPPHYINLNLFNDTKSLRKGQIVRVDHQLRRIPPAVNPYGFPAQVYWNKKNTSHEVFLYDVSKIKILKDTPPSGPSRLRLAAGERLDNLFSAPSHAGLLKALLLGWKEGVSQNDKNHFRQAGLMHILSVSGLHVGIVTALLFFLLYPLRFFVRSPRWQWFIILLCLWFYAALTGMNIPVVRATLLMTFYLVAQQVNRRIHRWNVYLWAVLIVLTMNPFTLFTVSFQLSFGAVASILFFYKEIHRRVIPILGKNYFSGLVAVSLSAQLGLFPILLFHFKEVSLVSTLSSLLVIPLLFPLILLVFVVLLLPSGWSWLISESVAISEAILDLMTNLSSGLAQWKIASQVWVWSPFTLSCILITLLFIGLHLEFGKWKSILRPLPLSFLFMFLAFFSESSNVFLKRNRPVAILMDHPTHPVLDLYYKGYCYTNYKASDHLPLIKSRKHFYTKNKVLITNDTDWIHVIRSIESDSKPGWYKFIPFNKKHINPSIDWRDYVNTNNSETVLSSKWQNILTASSGNSRLSHTNKTQYQ